MRNSWLGDGLRQTGWNTALIVLVAIGTVRADEEVDYTQDIKPLLSRRCATCHGAVKQNNGLRLDTAELAKKGGDAGPAVAPGDLEGSLLLDAVQGTNGVRRMPPEGEPLSAEQIELLKKWIAGGAKAPVEAVPQDPSKHWAYQLPRKAPLPQVANADWSRNPIDNFVAATHAARGVTASPPAAKNVLLRRLYLDLVGVPPTREELQAFLDDPADDAYEKVVDRLLQSPQYGERWGRHWMDVWRYSDWDGFGAEVRESKPHIWRWRDWIVESLNADRAYDRLLQEMLAGDELAPDDPATLRATGFLVRNWFSFNRNVWLDATIEHTAKAFLGTTLNCARCHDHMYDPITQPEYYQFRAFFEAHDVRTDRVPGQPDSSKDGLVRVYDAHLANPTYLFHRGNEKQPQSDTPLSAAIPAVFQQSDLKIEPVTLPPQAHYPGFRDFKQAETLASAQAQFDAALAKRAEADTRLTQAKKALADFQTAPAAPPTTAPQVVVEDNIADKNADARQVESGDWTWAEGKLRQSLVQNAWTGLLHTAPQPTDLQIKARFKSTGGVQYKSVGVCFDHVDAANFVGVYLSVSGKVQLFHREAGQDKYPEAGMAALKVEVGRDYTLQVAIVGQLVNVWVDDALLIAYQLPKERPTQGKIGLWTYDASAEFSHVSLARLPAGMPLVAKVGDAPQTLNEAQLQAAVSVAEKQSVAAEKAVATAIANRVWTQARLQADKAELATPPSPLAKELAQTAALAEKDHALRLAEQQLAEAEWKLADARRTPGNGPPIMVAEQALAAAVKARDQALEGVRQPGDSYTKFGPVYPAASSGRRLALARWITSPNNPLTARVAINHIWLRHIGSPLVPTVFDFGLNGKPATHPELLDWLAVELQEQGWRMKPIHRLIVTSQTYRQSSSLRSADDPSRKSDPENVLLWRYNARRLEAEAVRDAVLAVAGSLDPKQGGPEIDQGEGLTNPRRSLYFRNSKEKKMTFLDAFDRPNVVDCYKRSESIVPQQALAQANSPLTLAEARKLAGRLSEQIGAENEEPQVQAFVNTAFAQILSRPPTAGELAECTSFVAAQTARYSQPEGLTKFSTGGAAHVPPSQSPHQRARENLIHVLLNHNDFVTLR
ncbi:MAG: DUF1553 domain-containing protein [Planctomycetaceae bacterium]